MGLLLKQSTAATVKIGPFLDDGDGKTAETGLAGSLTQAAIRLSKNGGNMAQKNQADACSHDELGYYDCSIDTTDTDTLGRLQLMVHVAGALPVYHEYMVVTAHVYDSQCGSDYQQVDVIQIGSTTQTATDLKDLADTGYDPATHKVQGVVLTDTCTTCTTTTTNTDLTAFAANYTAARAGYLDELAAANLPTDIANVKAETATILADTNELQTDWTNGGRLDLLIDAIKAITDLLVLADIADTVWDEVMDTNAPANCNSGREYMNLISSTLAGKTNGGGTATLKSRDLGDTKDRATLTVDADGNRTASMVDGT